jgi:hypothetical protein
MARWDDTANGGEGGYVATGYHWHSNDFDGFHVATPFWFILDGARYLYYSGCSDPIQGVPFRLGVAFIGVIPTNLTPTSLDLQIDPAAFPGYTAGFIVRDGGVEIAGTPNIKFDSPTSVARDGDGKVKLEGP